MINALKRKLVRLAQLSLAEIYLLMLGNCFVGDDSTGCVNNPVSLDRALSG